MYFAEHKFDRCQTCFCLIRAASMPTFKRQCRLNLQVLQRQNVATANPQRIQNIQGCTGYKSDLRFIFVRALYLLALFVSRIILQNAHGWARNKTEAMCNKLSVKQCTGRTCKRNTDVAGSKQKRRFLLRKKLVVQILTRRSKSAQR